ncbi:uncharacterized protein LOC107483136 [Arachis duranensis]|uniref:Uncharacterized protein LOC107483136 n=1 Tax=Arachis duranensis TaxID=130453 RepID=A0A6P4D034_ARADU|nr:uncharacterized protein LOC107483136 [Arachis duranensis]
MNMKIMKFEEEIKKVDDMVSNMVVDRTVEARRRDLVSSCKKWYIRKELYWKQILRSKHAKEMDKNIRYFHNLASARRRNNQIESLLIHGRIVRNQARNKVAIKNFYKNLYHQETSPVIGFCDGVVNRITEEEAAELEWMPSNEKIKDAVCDCESTKAPGSDGYNKNFIKKCWEDVGGEFTAAVMGFFQSAVLPRDVNVTWVTLASSYIKDPGSEDTKDNAKWLKLRKKNLTIIKPDFQKAYDRAKWSFVDIVFPKMGFGRR